MSEYHELCQLRIDGLKDTIATLTAQLDAARAATVNQDAVLQKCEDELAAAEKELQRLREINHELVCSHNDLLVVIARMEDDATIATLTAQRDAAETELTAEQTAHWYDLVRTENLEERLAAADKVCEAAEETLGWIDDHGGEPHHLRLSAALTEWRITREGA